MKEYLSALHYLVERRYNPLGPFVQAYHETNGFKSSLCTHFNYAGMKPNKAWKGDVVEKKTFEYEKGKRVDQVATFKGFPNALAFMANYDERIQLLYPESYVNRGEVLKYFVGLQSGKNQWATDPSYVPELTALYRKLLANTEIMSSLTNIQVV